MATSCAATTWLAWEVGVVEKLVYVGAVTQVHLRVGGAPLQALVANDGVDLCAREGEQVDAHLPRDAVHLVTD